ncbi:MAG TPA: hypothetical protein VIP82_04230, partial [Microbacterium sp.]|uniref:hypothetical protein n=1 Tax=Microbacterium sp. TaxID=51671 RepID=UPI002F92F4DC
MNDETDAAGETPDDGDPSIETAAADTSAAETVDITTPEAEAEAEAEAPEATEPPKSGVLAAIAAFARRHRLPLMVAGGVVAFGLIGAGAVAAGIASGGGGAASAALTTTPT